MAATVSACGSGNSSTDAKSPQSNEPFTPSQYNDSAPMGPLHYDAFDLKIYSEKINLKNQRSKNIVNALQGGSAIANCGTFIASPNSTWEAVDDGLKAVSIVNGLVGIIPEAAPITAAVGTGLSVTNMFTSLYQPSTDQSGLNNCLVQNEAIMENQILANESQIANLTQNVTALQSDFYKTEYQIASLQAGVNGLTLQNGLSMFIPMNNNRTLLDQILMASQLLKSDLSGPTGNSLEDVGYFVMPRINLDALVVANQAAFQNSINLLSATYVPLGCTENCYASVQSESNGGLVKAYTSFYNALQSKIVSINNSSAPSGSQYNQAFDDYNNTLIGVYNQALFALNSAYNAEWIINKMNFMAYAHNSQPSFAASSLGQVPGTYYDYATLNANGNNPLSFNQNAEAYNQAQIALTKLYMARANALYTTTLNYIVTDTPNVIGYGFYTSNTAFVTLDPESGFTVNPFSESDIDGFAKYVAYNVGKAVSTPVSLVLESSVSNGWANTGSAGVPYQGIYYQYGGLRSLDCVNQVESFTATSQTTGNAVIPTLNNNNCPAIYSDINGNLVNQAIYVPGSTIQPYMIESDLSLKLSEPVTNVIAACNLSGVTNTTGGLYLWHPSKANNPMGNDTSSYIMCNEWSTPTVNSPAKRETTGIFGAYSWLPKDTIMASGGVIYDYNADDYSFVFITVNNVASLLTNFSSSNGAVLKTLDVNDNLINVDLKLVAGDITNVPFYTSNNSMMNTIDNNNFSQTVYIGNVYNNSNPLYLNTALGNNQYTTLGYVFNLALPNSEGLNVPMGIVYNVYEYNGNNWAIALQNSCVLTQNVLLNTSNGMTPLCTGQKSASVNNVQYYYSQTPFTNHLGTTVTSVNYLNKYNIDVNSTSGNNPAFNFIFY